ncbi:uncharacterized protein LOC111150285 isoform X1 [Enhydra lutris kenyoni]|uniref:Uncharacterized protein LOC111150285 isoform X1 n=1 Tax=Enhydra lutris kenyoni TaxID=391180 RepID=A0A2Y9K130_ENHLU|nr:uncharacterized protein LOC111150285 isoform X1 [Enhydra lutris kenyoni]
MSHDCRASWVEFEHALPVTTWVSLQIRAPIAWKSRRKGCFPHSHCGVGLSQHCLMPLWCDRSAYLSLRLVPAPPKEMEHFNRTEAQHVRRAACDGCQQTLFPANDNSPEGEGRSYPTAERQSGPGLDSNAFVLQTQQLRPWEQQRSGKASSCQAAAPLNGDISPRVINTPWPKRVKCFQRFNNLPKVTCCTGQNRNSVSQGSWPPSP